MKKSTGFDKQAESSTGEHEPVREMISSFTKNTSLHGVKFIMDQYIAKPRRLLWAIVVLCQLSGFVVLLYRQLSFISDRPILTKSRIEYVRKLPFPAVTICNEAITTSISQTLNMSQYEEEILNQYIATNWTYFETFTQNELVEIGILELFKKRLLLQNDLITDCLFRYKDCTGRVQKVWSKSNLCYTVNSVIQDSNIVDQRNTSLNATPLELESFSPGQMSGLRLSLDLGDIPEEQYYPLGVKVNLHKPDERISDSTSDFIRLAPGSDNFIGIKLIKNKFLPPPFKAFGDNECVEIGPEFTHPLVTVGKYTLRACQDACQLQFFYKTCECRQELDAPFSEACNSAELIECNKKISFKNILDSLQERDYDCQCPIPCDEVIYETTLSSTDIPKAGGYVKRNKIKINLYFDRLRIESIEQVGDYTNEDVFAAVGGQMGLFLGASLITLIEILELCVRCVWRWLTGRFIRSTMHVVSSKEQH